MAKWKNILAGTMIAGLIFGVTGYAIAETTDTKPSVAKTVKEEQNMHKVHKGKLTEEQKQALKEAGVDLRQLKDVHKQVRDGFKSLHEKGKTLKEIVKDSQNEELKKQIKADLESVHAQLKQVRELHKANKELRKDLRAAVQASDSAKIKDAYDKLLANQKNELELINQANKALDAELKKVQK
jgi:hypothetical protein